MGNGAGTIALTLAVDGEGNVTGALNNVGQSVGRMASEAQSAGGRMAGSFKEMAAAFTVGSLISKGIEMVIQSLGKLKASITEMTHMAARAETLGVAMRVVANNAGYTGKEMDEFEKHVRGMGIATIEARESLTKMAGAQMDLTKSAGLARIAQDAAVIGNINSSDAFSRMIQGIRSGEVEILKTIGINVNFEQSYKKLADALGKKRDALSETEKVQARTNAVMEFGINISGVYEAAMGTTGKQLTSLKRYYDDLKVAFGSAFSPALGIMVEDLTNRLQGLLAHFNENKAAYGELAKNLAEIVKALTHPIDTASKLIYGQFNGTAVSERTEIEEQNRKNTEAANAELATAKERQKIRLGNEAREAANSLQNQKAAAAAMKVLKDKEAKEASDRYQLELQDQKKAADERVRVEQAAAKEMADIYELVLQDQKRAAQDASDRYQLVLHDQEKAKKAALEAVEAEKKARVELYNWLVLHDPYTGAMQALKEYGAMASEIGKQTGDIVYSFFTGMEDALTSFVRTGKLSFTDLVNSMLDQMARMAVQQGITGPLSSMLSSLMSGTAATYLPQMAAGSAGLLDGTSAGGLSSLVSAVSLGAKAGTATGASSGITAGLASIAPYLGIAVGGYMLGSDMFKSGGLWNNSTGGQRAMRAVAYSNPFTLPFALLDQFTGGGLFGTKWGTTGGGLSLGVSGGDIMAQSYVDQKKKKGWFSGNSYRTNYSDIDPQMQQYLESSYSDVLESIRVKSATLGNRISEEAVKGFTTATTKINLSGLDGEAQQKALADYFRTVSNEALAQLVPDIASQIRLGEDATAAYARLNALKLTNNSLLMKELELLGQGSGAKYKELLNTQREAELLGVDASTQAIQRRIWALEDEQKIMEETNATRMASLSAELTAAQKAADLWRSAAQTLDATFTSVGMAGLSPEAQLAALRGQFAGAVGRFQGGDITAAGQVSSLAQSLQAASRDYYASGSGFASDSAALQDTLSSLSMFANTQASGADVQVAALNTQIDQMKNMNTTLNKIAASLDTIESKTSLASSAPLSVAA